MIRVNVVPVKELCDQHLLAEHRELVRIPLGIVSGKYQFEYGDRPFEFISHGIGHIKFFTNKLRWLFVRYVDLHAECERRGLDVPYEWPDGNHLLQQRLRYWNDWSVTRSAMYHNRIALRERMPANPKFTELSEDTALID